MLVLLKLVVRCHFLEGCGLSKVVRDFGEGAGTNAVVVYGRYASMLLLTTGSDVSDARQYHNFRTKRNQIPRRQNIVRGQVQLVVGELQLHVMVEAKHLRWSVVCLPGLVGIKFWIFVLRNRKTRKKTEMSLFIHGT